MARPASMARASARPIPPPSRPAAPRPPHPQQAGGGADEDDAEDGGSAPAASAPARPRARRRPIRKTRGRTRPAGGRPGSAAGPRSRAGAAHPGADRARGGGVQRRSARPVGRQGDGREQGAEADRHAAQEAARAPGQALRALAPLPETPRPAVLGSRCHHLLCPKCSRPAFMRPPGLPGQALGVAPMQR